MGILLNESAPIIPLMRHFYRDFNKKIRNSTISFNDNSRRNKKCSKLLIDSKNPLI